MCLATFGSVRIDVERMIIDRVSKFVYKKVMLYNNIICNKKSHKNEICVRSSLLIDLYFGFVFSAKVEGR